uniref:Uncharacterized protein n=1 Tax=Anguilla anguilla TaxID=7936 RepID=A0A0E9PAD4_ANGAN
MEKLPLSIALGSANSIQILT